MFQEHGASILHPKHTTRVSETSESNLRTVRCRNPQEYNLKPKTRNTPTHVHFRVLRRQVRKSLGPFFYFFIK